MPLHAHLATGSSSHVVVFCVRACVYADCVQETIVSLVTKLVILALIIFSILAVAGPRHIALETYGSTAIGTTVAIWLTIM